MNELKLFENEEFGEIRTVVIDGEVWFVGLDIAKSLVYQNPSKAISNHCKRGKTRWLPDSLGRRQQLKIIPEGDLYRLIVKAATQSNNKDMRDKAERFESWIFDEVLPSIRQAGAYALQTIPDSYAIEDPVERAKRWIEEQEEKRALEQQLQEAEPKIGYFDALVDSNLLTNFRDTAKELGYSQTEFTGWLLMKKYVYKDSKGIIKPYEPYRKQGLFVMKDFKNPYNGFSGTRTYVTVKGKNTFRPLMQVPDKEIVQD